MRSDTDSDCDREPIGESDRHTYSYTYSDSYGNVNCRWNTVAIANMRGHGFEREL